MQDQYIHINQYGDKFYYSDKQMEILHREDGAAVEWVNGYKAWFLNGKRHREDGAAIEYPHGTKVWFWNNQQVTQEQHQRLTQKEIILTLQEIADKFSIDASKLTIKI